MREMEPKWRVNILALIGAFTGFIAVFSGWMFGDYSIGINLLQIVTFFKDAAILIPCIVFIIGTLIAFLCPFGGIIQLGGVIGFFVAMAGVLDRFPTAPGPYLGFVSAIIVIVSTIKPLGLHYGIGETDKKGGFFTFSRIQSQSISLSKHDSIEN